LHCTKLKTLAKLALNLFSREPLKKSEKVAYAKKTIGGQRFHSIKTDRRWKILCSQVNHIIYNVTMWTMVAESKPWSRGLRLYHSLGCRNYTATTVHISLRDSQAGNSDIFHCPVLIEFCGHQQFSPGFPHRLILDDSR